MLHNVAQHIKVFRQQNLIELQAKVTMCVGREDKAKNEGKSEENEEGKVVEKASNKAWDKVERRRYKPAKSLATLNCFNCNVP